MMRRLRVTADDFGLTPGVTEGILEAGSKGIVTHASVMAGGLDFDRAIALARDTSDLGIGVHLTLTWGAPQSSPDEVASLVGAGGLFASLPTILGRAMRGRLDRGEIAEEWRAQIEKVQRSGVSPTHLDSHHHIHLIPQCFSVAAGLAKEFGIPWLRRPIEKIPSCFLLSASAVKLLTFKVLCFRHWPAQTSDAFRGLTLQGRRNFAASLEETVRALPEGRTELMVHPANPDALLEQTDPFVHERGVELAALCDPTLKQVLIEEKIELDRAMVNTL